MSVSDLPVSDLSVPGQLPILSRGKHRKPRKGACFMELVSYLAGEPWSDHPACTHPLLAVVAREVNDCISDEARPRLALLIPSVIGLVGDDPLLDARIALLCASTALPVVAADRQRVMAVGIRACERELDGRPLERVARPTSVPMHHIPYSAQWSYRFTDRHRATSKTFRQDVAPAIVSRAVEGIAQACLPHPDEMLYQLLVDAISMCRTSLQHDADSPPSPDPAKWAEACALTAMAAGA